MCSSKTREETQQGRPGVYESVFKRPRGALLRRQTTADVQQNSCNKWDSLTKSNRKTNSNWLRHKTKGGRPPKSTSWFTDQPRRRLLPSFCSVSLLLASSPSCLSSRCSAGCQKQPEQVLLCSDLAGKSLASPSQQVSISSRLITPPLAQKCL